jgi:hypothetical protein
MAISISGPAELKQSLNADICACFTLPQALSVYEGHMIARICFSRPPLRAAILPVLMVLGSALAGCAGMSDSMTTAFADPAKYELYDCKQLETERKNLAIRAAELQGLMAKADTGVAGPVVAELAYRNDYVSIRGQARFAEQAWERSKCQASPPAATPAAHATAKGAPARGRAAR